MLRAAVRLNVSTGLVASAAAAKVRSKRSGNRVWPLTPPAYASSTVPVCVDIKLQALRNCVCSMAWTG